MDFLKPNQSYNASLTADYTAGDATLSVNTIPTNTPSIVTVARGTAKETRFTFTGTSSGLLTGVTRLDGANENIPSGVSVECMIDADFINQLSSAVFDQAGLKGLVYAADGGSNDTYAITLPVAPASLSDITGLPLVFKANTVNTGAATLNVNLLGAKTIKKNHDQGLADNDIEAGQIVTVVYDGTDFQMQSQKAQVTESDIVLADNTTNDVSATKHGLAPKFPNNTTTFLRGDGTYAAPSGSSDGWTAVTDTWTYASASTITVPSGAASLYQKGDRIKWTQTTVKYGVIVAVADTLLTIAVNSDYTVANAAISAISYSHTLCPMGYPTWFNYAPTHTGFSANPSGFACKYKIDGSSLTFNYEALTAPGTSNSASYTVSMPVSADTNQWVMSTLYKDNGSYGTQPGAAYTSSGSPTLTLYTSVAANGWTSSGLKGAYLTSLIIPF